MTLVNRIITFRNTHKFSAPTVLIGLGLLIFPLWGAYVGKPAITAGFGYAFLATASAYSLWYFRKQLKLSSPWLYIPIFTFLGIATLRLIIGQDPFDSRVQLFVYMLLMVAFYFTTKQKGESLLWFAVPAVVIYGSSTIIELVTIPQQALERMHGISANCNTLASAMVFCIFVLRGKWRWLIPLGVIAILLTGSYWALSGLIAGAITWFIMARKKLLTRRAIVPTLSILLIAISCIGIGFATGLVQKVWETSTVKQAITSDSFIKSFDERTKRLTFIKYAIDTTLWFGHGSDDDKLLPGLEYVNETKMHSSPTMVLYELGPIALLAWLVTMGYCAYKSRRYRPLIVAIFFAGIIGSYDFWHWSSLGSYYFLALGLIGGEEL